MKGASTAGKASTLRGLLAAVALPVVVWLVQFILERI